MHFDKLLTSVSNRIEKPYVHGNTMTTRQHDVVPDCLIFSFDKRENRVQFNFECAENLILKIMQFVFIPLSKLDKIVKLGDSICGKYKNYCFIDNCKEAKRTS